MSNGNDTHKKSSRPASKTGSSTMRRSGEIYLPSTVSSLTEWLTSLRQGSHASLTPSQGSSKGLMTLEISSLRRSELSVRWNPNTSSWKTCQVSFLHLLTGEPQRMGEPWSESLPASGTVSIGKQSELKMWAHPTDASGGGALLWRTPAQQEPGINPERLEGEQGHLTSEVENWATPTTQEVAHPNAALTETGRRKTKDGKDSHSLNLQDQTDNWATPTSRGHKDGSNPSEAVPTNYLLGHQAPRTQTDGQTSSESDQTSPLPLTKRLNPGFVEWLMGVPIGWTNSRPLAMASYQQWWQSFWDS